MSNFILTIREKCLLVSLNANCLISAILPPHIHYFEDIIRVLKKHIQSYLKSLQGAVSSLAISYCLNKYNYEESFIGIDNSHYSFCI